MAIDVMKKGVELATSCEWIGEEICEVFAEALTDANYHTLREKVMPIINAELKCDINPIG